MKMSFIWTKLWSVQENKQKSSENRSVIPRPQFLPDHCSDFIKQRRVLIVCVLWAVDEWAVGRSWKFQSKFFWNYSGQRRHSLRVSDAGTQLWPCGKLLSTPGAKTIIRQPTSEENREAAAGFFEAGPRKHKTAEISVWWLVIL